ncbi:Epidermal patterning factor-like protein [Thalictrum thalictroides]|uniref:Epidermal patterning factor-like protein n=1 Tax=Thalictrum thalictroides TaxID=46969 RepID=A0A7J6URB3_THATH|nr:Epidermal patterning factor-like protein [Thalictrum thalictroides]
MSPTKMRSLCSMVGVIRHHHRLLSTATAFALLFLASSSDSATTTTTTTLSNGLLVQQKGNSGSSETLVQVMISRRRLGSRLGSAPPSCRFKCGRCSPCKPVHVPIQPGRSMTLEYYPEAWRCKCGNKLFMP